MSGAGFALAASPARYGWSAATGRARRNCRSAQPIRPCRWQSRISPAPLGAARSGKPDAAKADIAKLAELRDKLREAKDAYWAEQVDIQRQVATAWLLNAEGKTDEALKAMSAAADAEDKTEKSPVTPGPLAPARELYGDHAARARHGEGGAGRVRGDAQEGAEPLRRHPRRRQGCRKAGEIDKARQHYAAAVALTENAEPIRDDVAAARAFTARSN